MSPDQAELRNAASDEHRVSLTGNVGVADEPHKAAGLWEDAASDWFQHRMNREAGFIYCA